MHAYTHPTSVTCLYLRLVCAQDKHVLQAPNHYKRLQLQTIFTVLVSAQAHI